MSKYLLDSNAIIGLLAGNPSLTKRIRQHAPRAPSSVMKTLAVPAALRACPALGNLRR